MLTLETAELAFDELTEDLLLLEREEIEIAEEELEELADFGVDSMDDELSKSSSCTGTDDALLDLVNVNPGVVLGAELEELALAVNVGRKVVLVPAAAP